MTQTQQGRPTFNLHLANDRSATQIEFETPDGKVFSLSCTAADLLALITAMGSAHARMVGGSVVPSLLGARVKPVYDPHWLVQYEPLVGGSALFLQHPAFGPVAFVFPRDKLQAVAGALARHGDIQAGDNSPAVNRVIN